MDLQDDDGGYYILYVILEILLWNNNIYGTQDAKLKLVLLRLVYHPNISLAHVSLYDYQTPFYDSVYFTELLENKYHRTGDIINDSYVKALFQ